MKDRRSFLNQCHEKASALVDKMTRRELTGQMLYNAPAIPRLGIPSYSWWNEALHGAARGGSATVFPQAIGLAASFDPDLLKRVGVIASTEQRARYNYSSRLGDRGIYKGLTVWSPNINIFRDPRWGRGQETYGEDPYLTSVLAVAFIDGLQGDEDMPRTAACAKHFAAHSGPEAERHHFSAEVTEKDMEETYLPAFRAAIKDAGVLQVMSAYSAINGIPSSITPALRSFVREECGFEGIIVSDCWALRDIHERYKYTKSPEETAAVAVKAGCDLNCGCTYAHLEKAIDKGLVSEKEVREAVTRLFTLRYALGTLGTEGPYQDLGIRDIDTEENKKANLEAAEKAIVLLKNDGILPLRKEMTIAVIGPNADSRKALHGNYHGTASRYTTVLEGISDAIKSRGRVIYAEGSALNSDKVERLAEADDRISEAVAAANEADCVVMVLGYDETIEGEMHDDGNGGIAGDRKELTLPKCQQRLLRAVEGTGKPIVAILTSGSGIDLRPGMNVKAILQAWYPGSRGGTAIGRILFGETSPSGKLPVTVYKADADLPDYRSYSMEDRTYRFVRNSFVLYPFGFGLTYLNTEYLSAGIENDEVVLTVRNTSAAKGDDVVELYARPDCSSDAPFLVGFQRFTIGENEKTLVRIPFDRNLLTVVDENGKRHIKKGNWTLFVSKDSLDRRIALAIEI